MNHSKAFWAVRNQYAEEMRGLWARNFIGEGLWGRGALLSTGEWEKNTVNPGDPLPEHLCGGTYRSRGGRKRKAGKAKLSYKEQKERRVLKKFGANGVALGEDAETKKKLEGGKKVAGKPRVAGSARGRELRAAAALARFEVQKKEEDVVKEEEGDETDSGEDYEEEEEGGTDAVDSDGRRILDAKGRGMVRVCGDEGVGGDEDAQMEMRELMGIGVKKEAVNYEAEDVDKSLDVSRTAAKKMQDAKSGERMIATSKPTPSVSPNDSQSKVPEKKTPISNPKSLSSSSELVDKTIPSAPSTTCPTCSFANQEMSATCAMCANVLDPRRVPGTWACTSQTCKGTRYRNAGDNSVCGVCGGRKPTG